MRHAENQALLRYWHTLRAGRPCPLRAEIDPRHMLCNISHLFILEDLGGGNIRFRLAGSALTHLFWMELRGMPLSAILTQPASESLREVVSETLAEPGVASVTLRRTDERGRTGFDVWELALLPLRSDRGAVDRLIGALHPLDAAAAELVAPPLVFATDEIEITPV
ncbi:MAG: PAS domain-containing protein, partial [Pseudomonadota bacterium]